MEDFRTTEMVMHVKENNFNRIGKKTIQTLLVSKGK